MKPSFVPQHPVFTRRTMLEAGAVGLLGLAGHHIPALRALADDAPAPSARAVIYIFLSCGLAQQDSFALKPRAHQEIRGEFQPAATPSPGVQICEHLPKLAHISHLSTL